MRCSKLNKDIGTTIRRLEGVRAVSLFFFKILGLIIGSLELDRVFQGFEALDKDTARRLSLDESTMIQDLNDYHYPRGVVFNPLGVKPEDPDEFVEIYT